MSIAAPTMIAADAPLFRTGQIGRMTLRSRFVQAPIFTQHATAWGEAGERWSPHGAIRPAADSDSTNQEP